MKWTEDKIQILKEYYPLGDWNSIFKLLEISDKSIVYNMVKKLGISAEYGWSEQELELLKQTYPHYTNKYLHEKYFQDKNPEAIRTMALKNGFHKSKEKSVKRYDKDQMIIQLRELSIKLGRTPLGKELSENGLASDKTYERYFGGYRTACEIAGIDTNSDLFGRSIHCRSKNGDLCFSKSEKTITDFFIDNNIAYKKEFPYQSLSEFNDYGRKTTDWMIGDKVFVEYFGLPEKKEYASKINKKRTICRDCNIVLIELYRKDLKKLHIIFKDFINKNP